MPGKLDKFKEILKIGTGIAGAVIPGASVLTQVSGILDGRKDKASTASADAIKHLAEENDRQDQQDILLANEIAAIKRHLGI